MPFSNLSSFLSFLESKRDLHRIAAEVDPVLEITEIVTRVVKTDGPALLFENVKGSKFPLLVNVLGSDRRVRWALGRKPAEVGEELAAVSEALMPPSPKKLWEKRSTLARLRHLRPVKTGRAPVLGRCLEPANLDALPIAQSWPADGGRFITFPLVVTKSPVDGRQNMGVYRMHVYGPEKTGMHWQIGKGGGYHYQQAESAGRSLPLAAVIGADPVLMMCGVLPLPEGMDEMAFAGFLRGGATKVAVTRAGLSVPAEAEFILEGEVPPLERRLEGPYGDHFGHYSLAADFPVFHVRRIHHRNNPVFPIAVVGKPPQEDKIIGDAVQQMLLPLLKIMHPEIKDMWAYQEAGFHNLLVISVQERFRKEAVKSALWALGEGQLSLTKCVVVVNPDVNVRRFEDVLDAIRRRFDPAEDFLLLPGTSQDTLDFTSFKMNLGSKMIIDATGESSEPPAAPLSAAEIKKMDARILAARVLNETLALVQVRSDGRSILEKLAESPAVARLKMVAAVSPDVPLNDPVLSLWGLFTRFDCARDVFFAQTRLERGHAVYRGAMLIDATWKPGYPDPVEMDEAIVKKVDARWAEYGFV